MLYFVLVNFRFEHKTQKNTRFDPSLNFSLYKYYIQVTLDTCFASFLLHFLVSWGIGLSKGPFDAVPLRGLGFRYNEDFQERGGLYLAFGCRGCSLHLCAISWAGVLDLGFNRIPPVHHLAQLEDIIQFTDLRSPSRALEAEGWEPVVHHASQCFLVSGFSANCRWRCYSEANWRHFRLRSKQRFAGNWCFQCHRRRRCQAPIQTPESWTQLLVPRVRLVCRGKGKNPWDIYNVARDHKDQLDSVHGSIVIQGSSIDIALLEWRPQWIQVPVCTVHRGSVVPSPRCWRNVWCCAQLQQTVSCWGRRICFWNTRCVVWRIMWELKKC